MHQCDPVLIIWIHFIANVSLLNLHHSRWQVAGRLHIYLTLWILPEVYNNSNSWKCCLCIPLLKRTIDETPSLLVQFVTSNWSVEAVNLPLLIEMWLPCLVLGLVVVLVVTVYQYLFILKNKKTEWHDFSVVLILCSHKAEYSLHYVLRGSGKGDCCVKILRREFSAIYPSVKFCTTCGMNNYNNYFIKQPFHYFSEIFCK